MDGATTSNARRGGQPLISQKTKQNVRKRLKESMKLLNLDTQDDFAKAFGFSRTTVRAWFRAKRPTTPTTAHVLVLAEEANIQPTWLLLGEGPEKRGAALPERPLASSLHQHIKSVLTWEEKLDPGVVSLFFDDPRKLLEDIVEFCRQKLTQDHEARQVKFRSFVESEWLTELVKTQEESARAKMVEPLLALVKLAPDTRPPAPTSVGPWAKDAVKEHLAAHLPQPQQPEKVPGVTSSRLGHGALGSRLSDAK